MKNLIIAALFLSMAFTANAYDPSWEGNHPDAKSEAWTWMGHLQEIEGDHLSEKGYGLIHYFTRNDAGIGSLTFRSSALTPTTDGIGTSYIKNTIYSAEARDFEFRTRENALDIRFTAKGRRDDVYEAEFDDEIDTPILENALQFYPGLKVASNFSPRKQIFHAWVGKDSRLEVTLYQIWQAVAPNDEGRIRFLGESETYTFSHPMLVAVGHIVHENKKRPVSGLMFLDRQWSPKFFGSKIFANVRNLFKFSRALDFSHSWSAFHVRHTETNSWSFVHLWQQFDRSQKNDFKTDYSGLVWIKDGEEEGKVKASDYSWKGDRFVAEEKSKIILPYAKGREGFFPTRYTIASDELDFHGVLQASPALQTLDQPIYLYEGYAFGSGVWQGEKVELRGRVESSRLLFRNSDYKEMIRDISSTKNMTSEDTKLLTKLNYRVKSPWGVILFPTSWVFRSLTKMSFWMSEIELKMKLFGKILRGDKSHQDPNDPDVWVY